MPAGLGQALDTNENRAADLERLLASKLAEQILANQARAEEIANRLKGAVGSHLADKEYRAGLLAAKLKKHLLRQLGQAYTYAYQFGIHYPTMDEVVSGLQTGDVAGSMGVAPTGELAPPDANGASPTGPVEPPQPVEAPPGPVPVTSPPVTEPGPVTVPVPPGPVTPYPIQPSPVRTPGQQREPTIPSQGGSFGATAPPGSCPPGSAWAETSVGTVTLQPPPPGSGPHGVQQAPGPGSPASSGPCVLEIRTLLVQERQQFAANGTPCGGGYLDWKDGPGGEYPWSMQHGWAVFVPIPWSPGQPVPPPEDQWEVVQTANAFAGAAGQPLIQSNWYLVLKGMRLFMDAQTNILYASYEIPPWGCGIREAERLGWKCPTSPTPPPVPGPGGGQCVPVEPVPGVCPIPQVPTCGPDQKGTIDPLGVEGDEVCKGIRDALAKIAGQNHQVADWLGMKLGEGEEGSTWRYIAQALIGVGNPIVPDLVERFAKWLQDFLTKGANAIGCDTAQMVPLLINRAVFEFVQRWTGAVPDQLLTMINQMSHTACQSKIPGGAAADLAYLADAIKQDEWECWHKAEGDHLRQAQAVRDAHRSRPTFHQAQALLRRQYIDQKRFDDLARQAGFIADDDKANMVDWEKYFPTIAESFRWQQNQLFNPDTVERFGLDQEWEKVWDGPLKDFADGHGLRETWARYHYMHLWKRPGYTELVEATRRLRPDRVADDLVFTEADLDTMLKQEGYTDFWIKRLKELRHHKPTRQDVRQQYMLHVVDEEEVLRQWKDQGFTDEFANQQLGVLKIQRDRFEYHQAGYPAGAALVNAYARGELTKNELDELATRQSYYPGQTEDIESAAELARDRRRKRAALTGVKHRFTAGLIGADEAQSELAGAGLDPDQIQELTEYWDQVKRSKPKQVAAGTLCTWRKDKLIGAGEQMAALLRLGYLPADANYIVADCTLQIEHALQRATEKAQQQATKAATQAAKSEAKNQKAKARSARNGSTP